MNDVIVVRDQQGKPRLARLIRWVSFPPTPDEFALVKVGDLFSVTEVTSGAHIADSMLEKSALDEAKHSLQIHTPEQFEKGKKYILKTFGPLPTVQEVLLAEAKKIPGGLHSKALKAYQ